MMSTTDLAEIERRKYQKIFHHKNYGKNSMGSKYVGYLSLKADNGHTVGDFGCARGATFPALIDVGFTVYPVDHIDVLDEKWKGHRDVASICVVNLWEATLPRVDYGICTDVMEHIPQEVVPAVISNIREAVKHGVLWTVAHGPDVWGRVIKDVLHVTQKPMAWWKVQFSETWDTVDVLETTEKHSVFWTE